MLKVNYSGSSLDFSHPIDQQELMRLKVWVCRAGDNAHGYPILEDALERAKSTLVGKPFVAKYDKFLKDVLGHEVDEVPIGVFLSEDDIFFENDENGVRWICAYATVWVRYAKDVAFVLERDKVKSVSMEMLADMNEKNEIEDFYFVGVTLIGVEPAIPMARAEIMEFSLLSDKVKEIYFSTHIKEQNVQFEHDVFKNNKGLSKPENFEEGGNSLSKKKDVSIEEINMSANENVDPNAKADTLIDEAELNKEKSEEYLEETAMSTEESELEGIAMEEEKVEVEVEVGSDDSGKTEDEGDEEVEDESEYFAKIKSDFAKLQEEHTVMMSELETLRQFKAEYDEMQRKMAIEETMSYVSDVLPEEMAVELKEKGMACKYDELSAWSNEVKAKALEFSKPQKKESFIRIGLNYTTEKKNEIPNDSIWSKL